MNKNKTILLLTGLTFLIASCSHLKVIKYTDEIYPPTSKVDVFRTNSPQTKYVEIAELSVRKKDNSVEILIEEAKKIGADGLILLGDEEAGKTLVPVGKIMVSQDIHNIRAIAIRYIKD